MRSDCIHVRSTYRSDRMNYWCPLLAISKVDTSAIVQQFFGGVKVLLLYGSDEGRAPRTLVVIHVLIFNLLPVLGVRLVVVKQPLHGRVVTQTIQLGTVLMKLSVNLSVKTTPLTWLLYNNLAGPSTRSHLGLTPC